jgi:hypothetical protein
VNQSSEHVSAAVCPIASCRRGQSGGRWIFGKSEMAGLRSHGLYGVVVRQLKFVLRSDEANRRSRLGQCKSGRGPAPPGGRDELVYTIRIAGLEVDLARLGPGLNMP